MIRLFTTAYPEGDPGRRAEYSEALRRNMACPVLDRICVLEEGTTEWLPTSTTLLRRQVEKRPLYDDFFLWIGEVAGPDDVSIIANSDIWFGADIGVARRTLGPGQCFALARWEDGRLFDRNDSQDCWIFRGPVTGVRGDFPLGVVRCDNRLLYELQEAGYEVLNPAFSIRVHHLHAGEREDYGSTLPDYVQPPYRYLWPHNLLGPVATLLHNLRHRDQRLEWRLDRRRLARTLLVRALSKVWRGASRALFHRESSPHVRS